MAQYAETKDEFWKARQEAFTKRKKGSLRRRKEKHVTTPQNTRIRFDRAFGVCALNPVRLVLLKRFLPDLFDYVSDWTWNSCVFSFDSLSCPRPPSRLFLCVL